MDKLEEVEAFEKALAEDFKTPREETNEEEEDEEGEVGEEEGSDAEEMECGEVLTPS